MGRGRRDGEVQVGYGAVGRVGVRRPMGLGSPRGATTSMPPTLPNGSPRPAVPKGWPCRHPTALTSPRCRHPCPHSSIDGLFRPQKRNAHVPLWNYTLLRAQVGAAPRSPPPTSQPGDVTVCPRRSSSSTSSRGSRSWMLTGWGGTPWGRWRGTGSSPHFGEWGGVGWGGSG